MIENSSQTNPEDNEPAFPDSGVQGEEVATGMKSRKTIKTIAVVVLSAIVLLALTIWGALQLAEKFSPSEPEVAVSKYFSAMANPKLSSEDTVKSMEKFQTELNDSLSEEDRAKLEDASSFDEFSAIADPETKAKLLKIVTDADSGAKFYDTSKLSDDEKVTLHLVSTALTEGIRMAGDEIPPMIDDAVTIDKSSNVATLDLSKVTYDSDLWEMILPDFLPDTVTLVEVDGEWKFSGEQLLEHWQSLLQE